MFHFLDLAIKVDDPVYVYKPFDKRGKISLFIAEITNLSSNIPFTIFSGSTFSEPFWIEGCPLVRYDFIPWAFDLLSRMMA